MFYYKSVSYLDFKTAMHIIIQILFYCSCNNPKFKLHCVTLVKGEVLTPLFTYTDQTTSR